MPLYTSTGALNVVSNDATKGRYTSTGALRINLVTGTSYVGLYAADGALNVIDVTGTAVSTYGGLYHPSGAIRGRTAPNTYSGLQAPDGSYYLNGLSFSPLNLFAAGEQGVWYDPSDFSTMFQDNAGTTPVTAVEQTVGLILDKSGRGNHASQATLASRPVLSARVNQFTYSEQFDNIAWSKTLATVTANNIVAPNGTMTADKVEATGNGVNLSQDITGSGASVTLSAYFKKGNIATSVNSLLIRNQTTATNLLAARVNLDTGVITYLAGSSGATSEDVGNGWWKFTITTPFTSGNTVRAGIFGGYPSIAGEFSYVWGADIRVTNNGVGLPTYQRIAAATDYDTNNFPYYLRFDGSNDSLATGTINPGAVDKAQVFAGVRKLSDATAGIVSEFSASVLSNNGSFLFSAPDNTGATTYGLGARGTTLRSAAATIAAPSTNVITGEIDISGDITRIRNNGAIAQNITLDLGTGNFLSYPLYIGRRNNLSLPFNGQLYSLIVRFSAANLSSAQIASAEIYVNTKTKAY